MDQGMGKMKNMTSNHFYTLGKNEHDVTAPTHYKGKKLEAIDVIEDFGLNFNLGNVLKYVLRAGKKDDRQKDLKKAMWYLNREIGDG